MAVTTTMLAYFVDLLPLDNNVALIGSSDSATISDDGSVHDN